MDGCFFGEQDMADVLYEQKEVHEHFISSHPCCKGGILKYSLLDFIGFKFHAQTAHDAVDITIVSGGLIDFKDAQVVKAGIA